MNRTPEDLYPDSNFYLQRLGYYESFLPIAVKEGLSSFVLAEGSKLKGYGEIEFFLDSEGFEWTLNFWKESYDWYIKKEQEREKRQYCSCDKPICKDCGKEIK